jgi:hypothetical protein
MQLRCRVMWCSNSFSSMRLYKRQHPRGNFFMVGLPRVGPCVQITSSVMQVKSGGYLQGVCGVSNEPFCTAS